MAAPSPFKFGYFYDDDKDAADKDAPLLYDGERHMLLLGVNGAGKSTRILIENLVTIRNRSLVIFDMKGELAAQTLRTRRQFGDARIVNPFNVLGLGSDGYNPLRVLDPDDGDTFFDLAKLMTLAVIEVGEKDKFFPQSAQGWFCAGIMWEAKQARREKRAPSLLRVRQWCLQPDQWQTSPDGKTQTMVAGVAINARRAVAEGGQVIADLAGRFARDKLEKSDQDVLTTLATETEFLVSPPIARDLEKGDWSFAQLKQSPTSVYIVLPPNQVSDKRRWTRLLMTTALCDHLRPGPVKTLFVLDEFRVSIGQLQIVNDFWALVRGYGVQFMPVCQSVLQLQALFGKEWENYAGQSGCVAALGPPGDLETARWMSERGGHTTIWQRGWSSGEGTSGGGMSTNMGESLQQSERAFRLPQQLMSMKIGTGRIWMAGHGDLTIPFFAPNYWKRAELRGLIDPNPYVEGGAAPSPKTTAPEVSTQTAREALREWRPGLADFLDALPTRQPFKFLFWLSRAVYKSWFAPVEEKPKSRFSKFVEGAVVWAVFISILGYLGLVALPQWAGVTPEEIRNGTGGPKIGAKLRTVPLARDLLEIPLVHKLVARVVPSVLEDPPVPIIVSPPRVPRKAKL